MTFNTPPADHGAGGTRVDRPTRSDDGMVDGVWSAEGRATRLLRIAIDQPASDVWVMRVAGEVDVLTTPLLDRRLQSYLDGDRGHVVVDLSEVTFLGAAGLGSLVAACEAARYTDVELHVTGADHRVVARLLALFGLHITLDIHPTVQSVVDAIGDSALIGPTAGHDA